MIVRIFRLISLCMAITLASWCRADQALPSTANDVYAAMRAMLNPRIIQQIADLDSSTASTNLNLVLDWIVHVSQPGVTNETAYFNSYKQPIPVSSLNFNLLTNRASRLSYIPPMVKLSLVFDDKHRGAVTRAIPGVDYPGVTCEDAGTTAHDIRLVLRAPKLARRFRVGVESLFGAKREMEFRWIVLKGHADVPGWERRDVTANSQLQDFFVRQSDIQRGKVVVIAVFARAKGGMWGPPSFIHVDADTLCKHDYNKGEIFAIDYNGYRDVYKFDEKGRPCGFTRVNPQTFERQEFANAGLLVVETYPNDAPKTARKVRYFIDDGKLRYEILDGDIHYKLGEFKNRNFNF